MENSWRNSKSLLYPIGGARKTFFQSHPWIIAFCDKNLVLRITKPVTGIHRNCILNIREKKFQKVHYNRWVGLGKRTSTFGRTYKPVVPLTLFVHSDCLIRKHPPTYCKTSHKEKKTCWYDTLSHRGKCCSIEYGNIAVIFMLDRVGFFYTS